MRKLIVTILSTLDGYAAGDGGNVFVMPIDLGFDRYNAERMRQADIMLCGASTYRQVVGYWPPVADNPEAPEIEREISHLYNDAIQKVVVSDSLDLGETAPWTDSTEIVRQADAHDRIAELKREDGGDIIVFGSVTLWNDLLTHGVVDELHLLLGPGVIGSGVPTFSGPVEREFRLLDVHRIEDSKIVVHRYAVN